MGGGDAAKRPSVQVGDPFTEKLLVECCLELFAGGLVVGIQDLGAAGVACATTELAAAGTGGMLVRLDEVPLRDASLGPPEILMSESQERMMAVVEPARVDQFLDVCAKWDVRAAVIGEVTDTGRLVMTWHGEPVVDIPPSSAADGPVYHRPLRPAREPGRAGRRRPGRAAPPGGRRGPARGPAGPALLARPGRQELGHRPVRPVRPRRHRAGHAGRWRPDPGGRGDRARHRAGHRRQRPLLPARPLPGHPAGAVRGLPERGGDRGAPAGRDELPEFRLAGGPRGDVAVRRGRARARGRLRRPRRPGHRRERQLLQPDRDGGHSSHPGHRGARRPRRRAPAGGSRVPAPTGRRHRAARPDRGGVRRLGLGARASTVIWAAVRRRPTSTPNGGWRPCSPRRPRPGCCPRPTTCPTEGWRSRSPSRACAAGSAARSGCPATRSPPCSASRPGVPSWPSARARRRPSASFATRTA